MNSLVKAIHLSSFVLQNFGQKVWPNPVQHWKKRTLPSHGTYTKSFTSSRSAPKVIRHGNPKKSLRCVYIYIHVILSNHIIDILYYITYIMYVNEYIKPRTQWIDMDYKSLWKWMDDPQYRVQQGMFRPWHSAPSRSPALKSDAPGIPLGSNSNDKSPIILKMGRYIISGVMGVPQSHPMVDHRFPKKKSYMFIHELWRARESPLHPPSHAVPRASQLWFINLSHERELIVVAGNTYSNGPVCIWSRQGREMTGNLLDEEVESL